MLLNFFSFLSITLILIVSLCGLDGHKACLEESGDGHGEAVHVEHWQQQQPVLPYIPIFKISACHEDDIMYKILWHCPSKLCSFRPDDLWCRRKVFFRDHLPPGPDNIFLCPFEVFENSRRYSLLKVHGRCRWYMYEIITAQGCWWNERSLNRGPESRPRLGSNATFFWDSCSNLEIDENFRISHNLIYIYIYFSPWA